MERVTKSQSTGYEPFIAGNVLVMSPQDKDGTENGTMAIHGVQELTVQEYVCGTAAVISTIALKG